MSGAKLIEYVFHFSRARFYQLFALISMCNINLEQSINAMPINHKKKVLIFIRLECVIFNNGGWKSEWTTKDIDVLNQVLFAIFNIIKRFSIEIKEGIHKYQELSEERDTGEALYLSRCNHAKENYEFVELISTTNIRHTFTEWVDDVIIFNFITK